MLYTVPNMLKEVDQSSGRELYLCLSEDSIVLGIQRKLDSKAFSSKLQKIIIKNTSGELGCRTIEQKLLNIEGREELDLQRSIGTGWVIKPSLETSNFPMEIIIRVSIICESRIGNSSVAMESGIRCHTKITTFEPDVEDGMLTCFYGLEKKFSEARRQMLNLIGMSKLLSSNPMKVDLLCRLLSKEFYLEFHHTPSDAFVVPDMSFFINAKQLKHIKKIIKKMDPQKFIDALKDLDGMHSYFTRLRDMWEIFEKKRDDMTFKYSDVSLPPYIKVDALGFWVLGQRCHIDIDHPELYAYLVSVGVEKEIISRLQAIVIRGV